MTVPEIPPLVRDFATFRGFYAMARHSAEERAAAFYRAGKKPAPAPNAMSPAAKVIWREVISSKPIDWFDAGSLGLLRPYCEYLAAANEVSRQLAEVPVGSKEFAQLANNAKILASAVATSARQLRLTVQATTHRDEQSKLRENGLGLSPADLKLIRSG